MALRLCTELRAPGCLHAVLESVAPRAPYLLENRSGHPLRYRQACKPRGCCVTGHSAICTMTFTCCWCCLKRESPVGHAWLPKMIRCA